MSFLILYFGYGMVDSVNLICVATLVKYFQASSNIPGLCIVFIELCILFWGFVKSFWGIVVCRGFVKSVRALCSPLGLCIVS